MNREHEIEKLQGTLRIPILDIVFTGPYAEIYSDGKNIGNISIYTAGSIIGYDTNSQSLNLLRWSLIFERHKDAFKTLVSEALGGADIFLTAATFGQVYANESVGNSNIGLFQCIFENDTWRVVKVR